MRRFAHRQAESQDNEKRAYHRLKQRKQDQPYYQRYYTFYILVILFGWAANILSGVTESSKLYAFYHDFLVAFSFAEVASWVLVMLSVVLLEIFHRVVATSYFKDLVENDTHKREMTPKLIVMLTMAAISAGLSFMGGFDLVRLAKQAPSPIAAQLMETGDITAAYSPLIGDLKNDIQDFRKTREWKGRLSDQSAKKWEKMKESKQIAQLKQAEALANLSTANLQEQIRVDSLNQYRTRHYEMQVNHRGYGLGFLSIFAMFILYACLWYDEEYQERKAIYLEKKYGAMVGEPIPTPFASHPKMPSAPPGSPMLPYQPLPPYPTGTSPSAGTENEVNHIQHPIGFYTDAKRAEMGGSSSMIEKTSGQVWTDMDRESPVSFDDRYTVPHTYRKGGKAVTVHYSLRMVNSRIRQYHREVAEAEARQMAAEVLDNRRRWLQYWQGKQEELLRKTHVNT